MSAVPPGLSADLQAFLQDLVDRLAVLETPQGAGPAFFTTSTMLNARNAAENAQRWGFATDLRTSVYSDGKAWIRTDTGASL